MTRDWLRLGNGNMRQRPRAKRRVVLPLLAITLSVVASSGCAIHRVRADFTGFEKAYADTSNRELLLNLARLQNHDPTYFFKMGQITSSYRMSATVPTSVGYASQSTVSGKSNTTGGATPGLSYESDPLFQFIPVNDETNAQLLLKQIPAETFYILYQQGWRIDQLFRVMVDRIEVTQSAGPGKGCTVAIYRNVPPALDKSAVRPGSLDDEELSSYAGFLRASAIAYSLQRHGNLVLREVSTFVPLDTNALSAGPSTPTGGGGAAGGGAPTPAAPGAGVRAAAEIAKGEISATDIEKAAEKDLSYEMYQPPVEPGGNSSSAAPEKILIGQRITSAKFYITPAPPQSSSAPAGMAGVLYNLMSDAHLKNLAMEVVAKEKTPGDINSVSSQDLGNTAFGIFLGAVQNGFAIEDDVSQPSPVGGPCPIDTEDASPESGQPQQAAQNAPTARLVLRSLIGVMAAAAQEQSAFDDFNAHDPNFTQLKEEAKGVGFKEAVPESELLPVLRIDWKPDDGFKGKPTSPLIELDYRDTKYLVADPQDMPVAINQYWNRDVFRLIAALTAQVTVDTSKYPIANILQLNSVQ